MRAKRLRVRVRVRVRITDSPARLPGELPERVDLVAYHCAEALPRQLHDQRGAVRPRLERRDEHPQAERAQSQLASRLLVHVGVHFLARDGVLLEEVLEVVAVEAVHAAEGVRHVGQLAAAAREHRLAEVLAGQHLG